MPKIANSIKKSRAPAPLSTEGILDRLTKLDLDRKQLRGVMELIRDTVAPYERRASAERESGRKRKQKQRSRREDIRATPLAAPLLSPPNAPPAPTPPNGSNGHLTGGLFGGGLPAEVDHVEQALGAYLELAGEIGLPKIRGKLSPSRRTAIQARLREHGLDGWREMLANAARMPLIRGESDRGWKPPGLDWFAKAANFVKVLERAYRMDGDAPARRPRDLDHSPCDVVDAALEHVRNGGGAL